jgi:hypothetical protein
MCSWTDYILRPVTKLSEIPYLVHGNNLCINENVEHKNSLQILSSTILIANEVSECTEKECLVTCLLSCINDTHNSLTHEKPKLSFSIHIHDSSCYYQSLQTKSPMTQNAMFWNVDKLILHKYRNFKNPDSHKCPNSSMKWKFINKCLNPLSNAKGPVA